MSEAMLAALPIGAHVHARYARRDRVADYTLMGWHDLGLAPGVHGAWSHVVMACVCNPEGRKLPVTRAPDRFYRRGVR